MEKKKKKSLKSYAGGVKNEERKNKEREKKEKKKVWVGGKGRACGKLKKKLFSWVLRIVAFLYGHRSSFKIFYRSP